MTGKQFAVVCWLLLSASTNAASINVDNSLTRITFGSCAIQSQDLSVFKTIQSAKPDLYLSLGDAIYGDYDSVTGKRFEATTATLERDWQVLGGNKHWQNLQKSIPILAIWDNHDYGHYELGADFELSRQSKTLFLKFFEEPPDSILWSRSGIYRSMEIGPEGQRVQIVMLDTRSFKSAPVIAENWPAVRASGSLGKFTRDRQGTLLGKAQWQWLEDRFDAKADLRIVASSTQIIPNEKGMDEWGNYPVERGRLLQLIRTKGGGRTILVSGNVHFGELSAKGLTEAVTLWELTSSGLTHTDQIYAEAQNRFRAAGPVLDRHFGMLDLRWLESGSVELDFQILNVEGQHKLHEQIILP
jgi:alkaline phosphatase D